MPTNVSRKIARRPAKPNKPEAKQAIQAIQAGPDFPLTANPKAQHFWGDARCSVPPGREWLGWWR